MRSRPVSARTCRGAAVVIGLSSLAGLALPTHAQSIPLVVRAATQTDGPLGPNLGAGVLFLSFGPFQGESQLPVVDSQGRLYFTALYSGPGISGIGLFRTDAAPLQILATGSQAPGLPAGYLFTNFGDAEGITVSDGGVVGLTARADSASGSPIFGLWTNRIGPFVPVVISGQDAPGLPQGSFFSEFGFGAPALDGQGYASFFGVATTTVPTGTAGIWTNRLGALAKVVAVGDPAVGFTNGTYSAIDQPPASFRVMTSEQSVHAFIATVELPGGSKQQGVFTEQVPGVDRLIAKQGDPATGIAQAVFGPATANPVFSAVRVADLGAAQQRVGFEAFFDAPDGSDGSGIWIDTNSVKSLRLRTGQPLPALPGLSLADAFRLSEFILAPNGAVSARARLTGPGVTSSNDEVIVHVPGLGSGTASAAIVAREGDPAPGIAGTFQQPSGSLPPFSSPFGNSKGQAAFIANVALTAGGSTKGLFATDTQGNLNLVARTGQTVSLGQLGSATILDIRVATSSGGQDGQRPSFNDSGVITFWASVSGNRTAIVSATVPALPPCYADCDSSGALNVFDYICFGNAFASSQPYADCDASGTLNVFDYICFGNEFAKPCP